MLLEVQNLGLHEVEQAATIIQEAVHEDANLIFGSVVDPDMEGGVQITVIATGFDEIGSRRAVNKAASTGVDTPVDLKNYSNWKQDETAASAEIFSKWQRRHCHLSSAAHRTSIIR